LTHQNQLGFLEGGGEMGEIIRNFPWHETELGVPENWPLSLKSTIGILLHSRFPMFLFWGEDLLCFYNDAYRYSLGSTGKHPLIAKKGKEEWKEIWDFVGPIVDQALTSGTSALYHDQLIPIFRNENIEDAYWTFNFSPAYNDEGAIAGVFIVCTETTEKVTTITNIVETNNRLSENERLLKESKDQLQFAIEAAGLGTWELNPVTYLFKGNERLKEWFGLKPEENIDLQLAIDSINEKDRERVEKAITYALTFESGGEYDIEYAIKDRRNNTDIIVRAKGRAFFDEDKMPYKFNGTLQDVTKETLFKNRLAFEIEEQKQIQKKLQESELFSKKLFFHSPIANLVLTGPEMEITLINQNMLDLLGRDQSVAGKPFFDVLPELRNTQLLERMTQVFTSGKTYVQPEEKIELTRFGKPYTGYYNYTYKALCSTSGDIYGIIVAATEVTQQVVSRKIIEVKEKELRDLIKGVPIGICVVSGEPLRAEQVNEQFLVICGKTAQQFEELTYWEVLHEIEHLFRPVLENVFATGEKFTSVEHEMILIRNGVAEKIFANFEYIPVTDINNVVTKVIILTVEVTEQVETLRKIEKAVAERTNELAETNINLKRSNNELEQFAYIASHDLQEPIRKISTFLEMLHSNIEDINPTAEKYFTKISTATNRMTTLIRDVLAYSQVTQHTANFTAIDLQSLFQSILIDFELIIEEKNAVIEVRDLPVIQGMPSQMIQLFSNLLSNALKFTQAGQRPFITVIGSLATKEQIVAHPQLSTEKNYYCIEFSDNGIGFDQEYTDRIFKIFQRLHSKTDYEGTGIGLSICRKIVETHMGHISVESAINEGTKFTILLPGN